MAKLGFRQSTMCMSPTTPFKIASFEHANFLRTHSKNTAPGTNQLATNFWHVLFFPLISGPQHEMNSRCTNPNKHINFQFGGTAVHSLFEKQMLYVLIESNRFKLTTWFYHLFVWPWTDNACVVAYRQKYSYFVENFIHVHHAPYHVSGVAGLMTNTLDSFKHLRSIAKLWAIFGINAMMLCCRCEYSHANCRVCVCVCVCVSHCLFFVSVPWIF